MFIMKNQPKMVCEGRAEFSGSPTALELIQAILQDSDLSPKLAMQARIWAEAPRPKSHEEAFYQDGGQRPFMFPVVDCYNEGRDLIKLVITAPTAMDKALTLMELKTKFLDAKVREGDRVELEYWDNDAGEITSVEVRTGKVHAGIDQHVIVVGFQPSSKFCKLRDEYKMPMQRLSKQPASPAAQGSARELVRGEVIAQNDYRTMFKLTSADDLAELRGFWKDATSAILPGSPIGGISKWKKYFDLYCNRFGGRIFAVAGDLDIYFYNDGDRTWLDQKDRRVQNVEVAVFGGGGAMKRKFEDELRKMPAPWRR